MRQQYERLFILIGVATTFALAMTGLWFWLKHSISIKIDEFWPDEKKDVEPEVVEVSTADSEEDVCGI